MQRGPWVQQKIAQALRKKGTPVVLRHITNAPGPIPLPNPPYNQGLVLANDAPAGALFVNLSSPECQGRLIQGDLLDFGPAGQAMVGVRAAGTLTNEAGASIVQADGVTPFNVGGNQDTVDPSLAYVPAVNNLFTAVPLQAALQADVAAGTAIGVTWSADDNLWGKVSSSSASNQSELEQRQLRVSLPASLVTTDPKPGDRVTFLGVDYEVVSADPAWEDSIHTLWNIVVQN